MSKRYYKPELPPQAFSDGVSALPINNPIGVYYRQSTDGQIGNISTSIQTVDMPAYLRSRGWSEENIYLIDMDAGVSGTTKIDERPGMRHLFELITERKIKAVACQDEDRLFRDVTQIQVNIFIEACRTANVLVITPNMIYDFANEQTGSFHARQFRFKCEMAADYIDTVIVGKLHRAKRRLMMEGRWAGFAVLPGYMVDTRKKLPDGSENLNWRRYVPFPEYAEVVNEYFRIFLSHAGNVHATIKHIHTYGPYYPDPTVRFPPDGYAFVTKMKRYGHGHCPARNGLINLLTNATLLGHWAVNGIIVRWNNHPAIVPEEIFWKAFNYLSSITLDGNENTNFHPFASQSRPSLEKDRPKDRPLCAGMLVSEDKGQWKRVGTVWIKERQEYIYMHNARYPKEYIYWRRTASYIDDAVVALLHKKLQATFAPAVWEATIDNANAEYNNEVRRIQSQIATLERVMESYLVSLATLTLPDMIRAVEIRYAEAQREHTRLSEELSKSKSQSEQIETLKRIKDTCDPTLNMWDNLSRDEQRIILHTFIQTIRATEVDGTGLQLQIVWVDGSMDKDNEVVLPKLMKNGWRTWLASETDRLFHLVDAGASQIMIAQAFPTRTWRQIMDKITACRGSGNFYISPKPIREYETYQTYIERTKEVQTSYKASSGDMWTPQDVKRLLQMFDTGASKLELLQAFPYRRWMSIAKKVKSNRGNDATLPQDGTIRSVDTIVTYKERLGEDTEQFNVYFETSSLSEAKSDTEPPNVIDVNDSQQDGITSSNDPQSTPDH